MRAAHRAHMTMLSRKTSIPFALAGLAAAAALSPGAQAGGPRAPGAAHASQAAPAVSGTVFNDANANGARDAGETGLAGWTVFVDLHGDGALSADDPSAVTGANGTYAIAAVPSGSYLVRVVQQSGYSCTLLAGCLAMQSFPAATTAVADFGEVSASVVMPPGGGPPPSVPPPSFGKTVSVGVVSGVVYVRVPPGASTSATGARASAVIKGQGFVPLTQPRTLPVGTTFDTRAGTVRITSAVSDAGLTQSGDFGAGLFTVLQNRSQLGLTQLNLQRPNASLCPRAGKARTAARRLLPKSVLALLRSDAKGKFRTRGRFSSATVRGTAWNTVERCDGTLTQVRRGLVAVLDVRRRRTVLVPAGRSYLARAR